MCHDPGHDPGFVAKCGSYSDTVEESDQASNKKYKQILKIGVNTPRSAKNYLTLKEKLEMRATLEKRDTEEEEKDSEFENQKIQNCLGNDLFVAKAGSDSTTDEDSDQASNKKQKKITKTMPCPKVRKTAKNYISLEEKLEIIKLRENGVSFTQIGRDKNMNESSVRTLYGRREKLKLQATLANSAQHSGILISKIERTRSMAKMESLLSLWVQDLDKKGILVGAIQIQTKAKSLYLHVKENFEDKTEAEIKETFGASNGWFYNYKKKA